MNKVARRCTFGALFFLLLVGCGASTEVSADADGSESAEPVATAAPRSPTEAETEDTAGETTETTTETNAAGDAAAGETTETTTETNAAGDAAETETNAAGDAAETGESEPEWSVLGTFDSQNRIRRVYVLVPSGWTEAELTDLAHTLRAEADADPATAELEGVEHYVMDDDSQFETLLAELSNTEQGDTSNWPADYVGDHTVAYTKLYFLPDGDGGVDPAYILCFDLGRVSCDLDNPPARWDQ